MGKIEDASKHRRLVEVGGSVLVLLVSVLSLWVAMRTERANRQMVDANYRMVAAASWPFLQLESGNGAEDGIPTISLSLQNAGVGPAKVETFELFWNGKPYPHGKALLEACCQSPESKSWMLATAPSSNFVLRAGESQRFIGFARNEQNAAMWDQFDKIRFSELTYRVCYCSVFDECWVTNLDELKAQKVKNCPMPAVPFGELPKLSVSGGRPIPPKL